MSEKYDAIRVVYRPVTDDLPNGSKHLGDEQIEELINWEWETNDDGKPTYIRGETDSGRDVYAPVPNHHKSTVRARDADTGTYNLNLGWVQRFEAVKA